MTRTFKPSDLAYLDESAGNRKLAREKRREAAKRRGAAQIKKSAWTALFDENAVVVTSLSGCRQPRMSCGSQSFGFVS